MVVKLDNGEVYNITRLEDFREVLEPELYNAVENYISNNYDKRIAELKQTIEAYKEGITEAKNDMTKVNDYVRNHLSETISNLRDIEYYNELGSREEL